MSKKATSITFKDTPIRIVSVNDEDYISLTDMLRAKDGDFFISDWLRNRNTVEFLGIWERVNNPDFNYGEFATIRSRAGLNSYKISVKEWVEKTNAIGLMAKAGRYGGTYAHRDLAFEFGMWISPEFKIYLIKEFQRLQQAEQAQLGWDVKRNLTKINYRIHTDAIQANLIPPELTGKQVSLVYASEADVLNMALFGKTAKQWRDENHGEKGNIRDQANAAQLVCLANLENLNALFINEGVLFQTNQDAFVKTKRRLLDTCKLWCIVSLPPGLFTAAGAGVKTNLLFFTKGQRTEKIWYYDLADVKVGKKKPFTRANLEGFFECLPDRKDSERSWTLDIAAIRKQAQEEAAKVRATLAKPKENLAHLKEDLSELKRSKASKEELDVVKVAIREKEKEIKAIENRAQTIEDAAFDLKGVNPNSKVEEDKRSPRELIEFIEECSGEIDKIMKRLKTLA